MDEIKKLEKRLFRLFIALVFTLIVCSLNVGVFMVRMFLAGR